MRGPAAAAARLPASDSRPRDADPSTLSYNQKPPSGSSPPPEAHYRTSPLARWFNYYRQRPVALGAHRSGSQEPPNNTDATTEVKDAFPGPGAAVGRFAFIYLALRGRLFLDG